jgi:hypothetical protein
VGGTNGAVGYDFNCQLAAVVERTLKEGGQKVRAKPTEVGQVRVRFRPYENASDWRLEMLNGALRLQELYSLGEP